MTGRRTNRTPLYSRSPQRPAPGAPSAAAPATGGPAPASAPRAAAPEAPAVAASPNTVATRGWRSRLRLAPNWSWALAGAMLAAVPMAVMLGMRPASPALTQKDIDAAVLHTLHTQPLPAAAAKAYEAVAGSVVRVVAKSAPTGGDQGTQPGQGAEPGGAAKPRTEGQTDDEDDSSVGTGVVIIDSGVILTNLHVVAGARQIEVVFADGLVSAASIVNVMPDNDLAVLRAHRIPDDLKSATMRSTADLRPGDRVTAVGFPFGIGPSVSHGVVSGLKREFRSPEGERVLTNLIQFDAMANPGSSGGPLVTDQGEVVGIVTAIYNPVQERFFVGIGFAVPIESAAAGAGLPPF